MRTGRNWDLQRVAANPILDHWDMRTGRNRRGTARNSLPILDHWDMRTGRNLLGIGGMNHFNSRSLGYAHWPEQM